ncbi:restriction endonuclease subunit S [Metamycoplasma equirhinis]|uniref:restriction endonuclease subunit S n=1 Tax=Metamycoplasma equirhinis TaxID=92402 RepID=UPI0035945E65
MKLKEIIEICYGKNQKQVEVKNSNIPILGTGGIIGYSSKPLYNDESVLIGRKGNIGMPFYINKPFWTIDTLFYTKINKNVIMPKYLYYLLCTIGLERYSEGAAVPSLTTKTLYEIELNIPNMNIQQHIVNTIGTVDDLIENLQRQTKEIIDIGELLLQKSSQNKPIIDYASILLGGTPSRKHPEYWNGSIKWINSGAITGTPAIQNESELITVAGVENSATKCAYEGDSVLSIIEPSKNKVAVVLDNEVYFNQSVICLHPNDIKYKGLIFFSSRLLIDRIKGYATGAAQQSLNKDMIEKQNILVPKDADIIKLNNLLLKIVKNENKVRKLKSIKEKLLEKYF